MLDAEINSGLSRPANFSKSKVPLVLKNELNDLEGGFKLSSLEVFNWGTFDGKIWKLDVAGDSALITGVNGSGKSTLVDALLTLLVSNNRRNYNLSSGSGRRERSEATYVRGAFGREMEGKGFAKTKYCREENSNYSVLLGRFQNFSTKEGLTLVQFFWYDRGDLKKFYLTSSKPLTIEQHFSGFTTPQDLRKRLKQSSGVQIFDSFSDYQLNFIGQFGPKSIKAMDLFNQTVAIKEVGNLSDFVRKHMLEAQPIQDQIDQLFLNYDNLNLAHLAILEARSQLEILEPIGESATALAEIQIKQVRAAEEEKKIPLFFSLQRKSFLQKKLKIALVELKDKEIDQAKLQQEISSLLDRKTQLTASISHNASGQELEKLELLIRQNQEVEQSRHQTFDRYAALAKKLGLGAQADGKVFSQTSAKLPELLLAASELLKDLQEQTYQLRREQELSQSQMEECVDNLGLLRKTKANIPAAYVRVRDDLCVHLDVPKHQLPFVAEILQVQSKEKKTWNTAIEKLLRSFGLRLLVPAEMCTKVNKYIGKNNLGIKLIYSKVDLADKIQFQSTTTKDSLFSKLDFLEKSAYSKWLKAQVSRDFDFLCTEDFSLFQGASKAMMPSGLIKRGPYLHEKDDRFSSQQFQSLLGWDNEDKLAEIQARHHHVKQQNLAIQNRLEEVEDRTKETGSRQQWLRELSQFGDFSTLDWKSSAAESEKLNQLRTKLSQGKFSQLHSDLEAIKVEENSLQASRDNLLAEIAVLRSNIGVFPAEIEMCDQIIKQILSLTLVDLEGPEVFKEIEKALKRKRIDLALLRVEQISVLQRELLEEQHAEMRTLEQKISGLQSTVLKKMTQFKVKFSESSLDLQPAIEYLPDYLTLLQSLKNESLPEHEKRFKALLNKSVVNDMAAFKSTLEMAYEDISETVNQLNEALRTIPYSPSSHVQLYLLRSKDVEIREFSNMLKNALKTKNDSGIDKKGQTVDLEESFSQIKKILDHMKKDPTWCKSVTDVRNWADFYVLELHNADATQKNYYADSAGLSGGQKAKLAFTILASAIAYQYGLHKENSRSKSFRFVVIDEAFSKSDEKNSQYAMDLFLRLGLQLMVVTPKDKIYVAEPYVKKIFFTHINDVMNNSKVTTLTIDEFRKLDS